MGMTYAHADIIVIGNPTILAEKMDATELADIFLKRHATLSNGNGVVPVHRSASSSLREQFESKVIAMSARELKNYWLKLRFKGVRPPVVQDSTDAAILFVTRVAGAITYIEADEAPDGVKVLMRLSK